MLEQRRQGAPGMIGWLALLIVSIAELSAQTMSARFLTEFRRVGADGEIVAADAIGTPREIISPALIRNGYTSFHLVVTGPPGASFMLYIASNPDRVLRPVLHRVIGADRLEPLKTLNDSGKFNDKGVSLYWLDVWTPGPTPVRRIRLEAQLNMGQDFVITPLELRVLAGVVPAQAAPAVNARRPGHAAASSFVLLDQTLCGAAAEPRAPAAGDALSIMGKIMRNAGQDMLLARKLGAAAAADTKNWCGPAAVDRTNPESYLSIRDAVWRASQ